MAVLASRPEVLNLRLLTPEENVRFLPECQAYTEAEFGSADAFSIPYLTRHREEGVQFYRAYGDVRADPPAIRGLASFMFISEAMRRELHYGTRRETDLDPWKPEDGPAVLWVSAVVSHTEGAAAKCISAVLDDVAAHPYRDRIDRLGAVCSGPQGFLMAQSFGMQPQGRPYLNGWLFMERPLAPGDLALIGRDLQSVWNFKRNRDTIREGRQIWGPRLKHGSLGALAGPGEG